VSIEADVTVSFRCDGCKKQLEDYKLAAAYCTSCRNTPEAESTGLGQRVREWADRQNLLGRLSPQEKETLERLAYDLDEPSKKSRAA
jgi:hypothetical protein